MSWRDAPLYTRVHELCRGLAVATATREGNRADLVSAVLDGAFALLGDVACALTFPETREEALQRADEGTARLRVLLRLARDVGAWPPGAIETAFGHLDEAGRMIGGWRIRGQRGDLHQGDSRGARQAGDPRRHVLERRRQVPVGVPEQEPPEEPERQPWVPSAPPSPEPVVAVDTSRLSPGGREAARPPAPAGAEPTAREGPAPCAPSPASTGSSATPRSSRRPRARTPPASDTAPTSPGSSSDSKR